MINTWLYPSDPKTCFKSFKVRIFIMIIYFWPALIKINERISRLDYLKLKSNTSWLCFLWMWSHFCAFNLMQTPNCLVSSLTYMCVDVERKVHNLFLFTEEIVSNIVCLEIARKCNAQLQKYYILYYIEFNMVARRLSG